MPNPIAIVVASSAARTSTGSTAALDLLDPLVFTDGLQRGVASLLLEVTAVSGTNPLLTVTIETSPSGTSWEPALAFDVTGAVGFQRRKFGTLERYVRISWAVAGTSSPTFTFLVSGWAEIVYATHEDFYALGLPKAAVGDTDPPDLLTASLLAASSKANSLIPRQYKLPLSSPYPESLKSAVCEIAAYKFLQQRGFDPDDPADKEVKAASDAALAWLDGIDNGNTVPDWIDATPGVDDVAPDVFTNEPRGW